MVEPVLTSYERERRRRLPASDDPVDEWLRIESDGWDEAELPRRPWIAKGYLLRGSISLIAGPGGAGKSMVTLGYAIAAALGRPWGRFLMASEEQLRVTLVNAEDDDDEQRLRLSAALRQHGATPFNLQGRLARISFNRGLFLFDFNASEGTVTATAAMLELITHLKSFRTDIGIIDPLIELHNANENDNQALRAVVAYLRQLARELNMAILIVHHSRKGSAGSAGDPDMIRGAGAIVGAVRVALTCCTMTEEEARELGVADDVRSQFFRVDGAKSNYAPLREAEWYERVEYLLANGESASAAQPWSPTRKHANPNDLDSLVEAIGRASMPYSPRIGNEDRSIAHLLTKHGFSTRSDQEATLKILEREHGVRRAHFRRPGKAKNDYAIGLRTKSGDPAGVTWHD